MDISAVVTSGIIFCWCIICRVCGDYVDISAAVAGGIIF